MPFFREGMFKADCDVCGTRFDPVQGGVCTVCKRILCRTHLHGSLAQRLKVTLLGAPAVCVYCRVAAPRGVPAGQGVAR